MKSEICHKILNKNETSFQAVCNKMALNAVPDELKHLKKTRKKS